MANYHTRSFSFPSKSHPVADQLSEQLCRLRSSQAASTPSVTSRLTDLKDLYKSVDEFLQLPQNQKIISQTYSEHWVEEVINGSLRLLDICSTSQEVLVQSKEQIQDIQSVLRRNMLKDVQAITADVFKSLLSYIGGSQKSSWFFSKLVHQKAEKETAAPISKFEAVDATLELICQKKTANVDMSQIVQLETEVQEIDEVVECLFRHLVKARVTLLNWIRWRLTTLVLCSGELNMTNEIAQYQRTRKTIKKIVKKCLKDIKEVEITNEADTTESLLKDVKAVTVDVFKSLLAYIGGSQKSN
ncbi:Ribonuclease 3 [Bienertia sinuspersici]